MKSLLEIICILSLFGNIILLIWGAEMQRQKREIEQK